MKLTKRMKDVLQAADLETWEVTEVPMATMYGLESRGLISNAWRGLHGGQVTGGRSFPWFRHVKLTEAGMKAARTLQGFKAGL